jgi:hypothetical protein
MSERPFGKYAKALGEPFPPELVKFRLGGRIYTVKDRDTGEEKHRAQALCYIDARDLMDRLDSVLGAENWQDTYTTYSGTVICSLGVNVAALTGKDPKQMANDGWVWKADGAGPTAFEAEKGQISDAFKRAGVRWGCNRPAYKLPAPWVDVEGCYMKDGKPKGGKIPKREMNRLMAMYENFDFSGPEAPEEPEGTEGAPAAAGEKSTTSRGTDGASGSKPRRSRSTRQPSDNADEPPPEDSPSEQERGGPAPSGRRVTWKMANRILAVAMARGDELKAQEMVDSEFHGYRIVQSLLKQFGLRTAKRGAKKDAYIDLLLDEVRAPAYENGERSSSSGDGGFSEPPKRRDSTESKADREAREQDRRDGDDIPPGAMGDDIPF